MLLTEPLIVLCVGVLAVHAKPQKVPELKDPFDDLVKELEDLNKEAKGEQTHSLDILGQELKGLDDLSHTLLQGLGETLRRDVATLLEQISSLQERAYELQVDIHECVGNSLDEISNFPERELAEGGDCLEYRYKEAEHVVNEGVRRVNDTVGPIDEYWRRIERCRDADRSEQEICIAELSTEIRKDAIEIPSELHLAVEEAIGHVASEKSELLLCIAGRSERVLEEGEHIVGDVTRCAESKFPPEPHPPQ